MKNKLGVLLTGALILLFWGCQPGPSPLSRMIPADSVAVLYLESPAAALKDASWLGENLGLTSLTEGKSLEDWAQDLIKKTDGSLDSAWFDLTRPAALALGSDGAVRAAVPLSGDPKALPGVQAYFTSQGLQTTPQEGWLVVSTAELALPVKDGFDFSKLAQGKVAGRSSALRYWLDIRGALKLSGFNLADLESLATEIGSEALPTGLTPESWRTLAAGITKGAGELETLSGSFYAGPEGIEHLSELRFTPEGWIHGLLSRQKPARGTREFLKYLPQDYLLGTLTNLDTSVWKDEIKQLSSLTGQPAMTAELQETLLEHQASRSAFSFDVDADPKALLSGNWGEGLRLYAVGAQEVKDAVLYKKAVLDYLNNSAPLLRELSDRLSSLGIPLSLSFKVEEGLKEGNLTYDKIALVFDSAPDQPLDLLSQLDLQINLATRKDRVFMTLGKKGLETLRSLAETDTYPGKTWSEGLEGLRSAYPEESHLAGNFNITRLLQVVRKIPEAAIVPAGAPGLPGITGYLQLESGGLITGTAWNFKEMEAVIKPFSAFFPLMLQGFGD